MFKKDQEALLGNAEHSNLNRATSQITWENFLGLAMMKTVFDLTNFKKMLFVMVLIFSPDQRL